VLTSVKLEVSELKLQLQSKVKESHDFEQKLEEKFKQQDKVI
jgi:hypothetical protein